jgi:hypothetical protein
VDDAALNQAYQSVLALEAGEGLVNQMVGQRFWRSYLKAQYPQDFALNLAIYNQKAEALLDRQMAGSISQADYERGMNALANERRTLLRRLTLKALEAAR